MLIEGAIMLDYACIKNCCYYAQNYASVMCQTLAVTLRAWQSCLLNWEFKPPYLWKAFTLIEVSC